MKVSAISYNTISFGRALSNKELDEFNQVRDEAKKLVGQTGKSVFIVHDACLPQSSNSNTGVGNLSTRDSSEFFKYMKPYLDFNMVEVLPQGQVAPFNKLYCAYTATALSLGNHQINPYLLATDEFEHILTVPEADAITSANKNHNKETIVNYQNVMDNSGAQNKALKKAYERFQALDDTSILKQNYNKYIDDNSKWLDFPRTGEPDIGFFKFKQFLADEHLKVGKKMLNDMGIKLCGDCLIGFSSDEVKAFPNAFKKDHYIGDPEWRLPALDYDAITDPNSDAAKLLKMKVQLFAKRYDAIRFDVGWAYISPIVTPKDEHNILPQNKKDMGAHLIEFIENSVREVKGENFDLHNLMYEFESDPSIFSMWKPNSNELLDGVKGRVKIFGSTYMNQNDSEGWGSNDAFLKRGFSPDEFVIGPGNHDPQPLRQIAQNMPDRIRHADNSISEEFHKLPAIKALANIFHVSEESLWNPVTFAKYKWAEPMSAKNRQMFYMDVFGREERFDKQTFNTILQPEENYAYKIPQNFKQAYHKAVEEGFGFNIMDSLEKIFTLKGYDKSHSDLYRKIVKFRDILLEPTSVSEMGESVKENITSTNVDIISPSPENVKPVVSGNNATKKFFKKGPLAILSCVCAGVGAASYLAYNKNKSHE